MNGSESSKQQVSILYVDDEPTLLDVAKLYLEHFGNFSVTTCDNAADALKLLSEEKFDSIVSDYQMPECNGIEFLRHLRSRGDNTPFIIFTGKSREDVVIEALNNGADFYLQKGGDPKSQFAELSNNIRHAVKGRKNEERYGQLFENMIQGFALHEIITDDNNKPIDYRFITVNPAFEKLTGLKAVDITGRRVLDVLPETESYWIDIFGDVALNGRTAEFENYSKEFERWYDVIAYSPEKGQFVVTFTDITKNKEAITELSQKNDELLAANGQLTAAEEELQSQMDDLIIIRNELQESREEYRSLIENLSEVIYRIDMKGRFTYISPNINFLTGYFTSNMLGKQYTEFIHPDDRDVRFSEFSRVISGEKRAAKFRILKKNGGFVWVKTNTQKIEIDNKVTGIQGILTDITDLKAIEEELRETNADLSQNAKKLSVLNAIIKNAGEAEDLHSLFKNSVDAVLSLLDYDAGAIYITDRENKTSSVVYSKNIPEILLNKAKLVKYDSTPYDKLLVEGQPIITNHYEKFSPENSRNTEFLSMAAIPLLSKGRIIGALNIASKRRHKITEDEKDILLLAGNELGSTIEKFATEEQSKRYAENLELFFNSIEEMVFILDMEGRIIRTNDSVIKNLKYSKAELSGREIITLRPEERKEEARENVRSIIAGIKDTCSMPIITKDGKVIEAETRFTHGWWDNHEVIVGVTRDVTDRKRAEAALHKNEEHYRTIFDNSPIGIELLDSSGHYINANPAALKIFGLEQINILRDLSLFNDPNISDEIKAEIRNEKNIRFESPFDFSKVIENNFYTTSKRGIIWLDIQISPLKSKEGIISGYLIQLQDVTERRKMREDVRKSEKKYRDLAENAPIGILTCDKSGKITYLNPRVPEILDSPGIDESAAINLLTDENIVKSGLSEILMTIFEEGTGLSEIETEYTSFWGNKIYLRIYAIPDYKNNDIDGARLIIDDISDWKRAEEALRITNNKLKLLSSITRHDILNQVMIIGGYLDLAERMEKDPKLSVFCNNVRTANNNVQKQIKFTREYEELGSKKPIWFDISSASCNTAKELLPVVCECRGLWIYADPMIIRAFYNLYDNALRHARDATRVKVSCRKTELSGSEDSQNKRGSFGYLIVFEDDGCGVADDMKEQIFERGIGSNTGLGLFLIREILAITGITIAETGVYGEGARFEITVPDGRWRTAAK